MKSTSRRLSFILISVLLSTALACSPEGPTPPPSNQEIASGKTGLAELVPYGAEPWAGIVTGGQPSAEDFQALSDAGLRTVINLRTPNEPGTTEEPRWLQDLGLTYVSIPVDGAAGLSAEVAGELDRALASADRPVLVHCGSSNRVGALFALRAFYVEGAGADEALEVGLEAGLTKLEDAVREMLH